MFCFTRAVMLANMSQHAEIPPLTWSDLGVGELLPTGTVTLLLADVEGSTRLWETQPEKMTVALAELNRAVDEAVPAFGGVRPVEQGEGDSFVAAFARASDAVACALALQQAPLAPIKLRVGLHTGEVQLRDESNYAGPTINRTARLRDLGHGGQTLLSGVTESLVAERLPDGAWLAELGSYPLRDLPRPERVVQLCHPDVCNEFPPLRVRTAVVSHNLPAQLTSFVGRQAEMAELRTLVTETRLVTLTGAGGAGKTRLAIEVIAGILCEFGGGIWYVELAPITLPDVVPVTVARTLGLPDQPGRSTLELLVRFFGDKKMLLLLDNCEHLLDACGSLVAELLAACPRLTILATSREPLGVPGELSWRVPSLPIVDQAIELFVDRARRARPDFVVGEDNADVVRKICERLDGIPLAIELAAARVRALSLAQILSSLHDRFRLLTGGARTAVRRQQTLRASVDWSHALLTEPEQVLFRRLAAFAGGFDLDAAQAVGASSDVEIYQLLDQLGLLVDKSLVVADDSGSGMRYRLLETVRQYAQEKLGESGEADEVRTRHCDYYAATASHLASIAQPGVEPLIDWAEIEIENLRAAFAWRRESADPEGALRLVSALHRFWLRRGRFREAMAGFDVVLGGVERSDITLEVWVRAVADHAILSVWSAAPTDLPRAEEALTIARELDDPGLIAHTLMACGMLSVYSVEFGQNRLTEAIDFVRARGDRWTLGQIFSYQTMISAYAGDVIAARAAGEAGQQLADALGDRFTSCGCRMWLAAALGVLGDLPRATEILRSLVAELEENDDPILLTFVLVVHGNVLAFQGDSVPAQLAARRALQLDEAIGGYYGDSVWAVLANAAMAGGDHATARQAAEESRRQTVPLRDVFMRGFNPVAEAALAYGDLVAARQWADDTVAVVPGAFRTLALTTRAFVLLAQGESEQAERDAQEALTVASGTRTYLRLADTLECLARLAAGDGNESSATRLLGAADALRARHRLGRLPLYQADYDATVGKVRETLGQRDFDATWAEGAALSAEEAIAYAQRGRGERKRPASGWGSLTPMEQDVVRLVAEGLGNREIGTRLFISPRTVQSHLTHVYAKLGLASRVQLVQEAARHG